MDRKTKRELEERERRETAAGEAAIGFYTATVDAPPHPHTVLGVAAGDRRATPMEAVLSMQRRASHYGADGVLGVSIIAVGMYTDNYIAYGTAVQWAQAE
ncbi:hypothetical protein ACFUJR_33265 [Streptomyces sp. NPDC057271]|uniref:hypothetical protein n=1 Tax=unclassified Streptomyces TaxID=2593676 RepID=UPI00363C5157